MAATSNLRSFAAKRSVKVISTILLFLTACSTAFFSACCLMLADFSAYSNEGGGFSEEIMDSLLEREASSIWSRLSSKSIWNGIPAQKSELEKEFEFRFSEENSNIQYAIYDMPSQKLMMGDSRINERTARYCQSWTMAIESASTSLSLTFDDEEKAENYIRKLRNSPDTMLSSSEIVPSRNGVVLLNAVTCPKYECMICLSLRQGLPVVDKYRHTMRFVMFLAKYRFPILATVVFSLAALLALFVLLLIGTGRKPGSLMISLFPWDDVPLEPYLLMMGGALYLPSLLITVVGDINLAYTSDRIFRLVVIIFLFSYRIVIIYCMLMSCARRCKAQTILRNTMTNRLILFFSNRLGQTKWGMLFYVRAAVGYLLLSAVELTCIALLSWKLILVIMIVVKIGACLFLAVLVSNLAVLEAEGEALRDGNVSQKIETEQLMPIFRRHGEALNGISQGMKKTVEEQMKSERMKAELIANVSHDLKTPLTSIISYVDLIQKAGLTDPEAPAYLNVLDRQANRLRKLVLDLVEASKATSGNVTVEAEPLDLNLLLEQAAGEYEERMEARPVKQILELTPDAPMIYADPKLLWRVFDNLLGNALKYSQEHSRIYISTELQEGKVIISFRNVSKYRLNISAEELMERFVRGDSSRHTEGSGLGLSIARGLTESQGGSFRIVIDGDLFKALLEFPVYTEEADEEKDEEAAE